MSNFLEHNQNRNKIIAEQTADLVPATDPNNSACSCAILNEQTGEIKTFDKIDKNGNLVYKNPLPWYKRILGHKYKTDLWTKWKYHSHCTVNRWIYHCPLLFGSATKYNWHLPANIYISTHILTGKNRYKVDYLGEINSEMFEQHHKIVRV